MCDKKRGRPKKPYQTKTKGFRFTELEIEFLESLENANIFVRQLINETNEYQIFVRQKQEQDNKNQPSLFQI